jgi:integrase
MMVMPAYKDEKTGTWFAKFRYKDWTDTTKDKTKRGFKTRREAVQWENDFKVRIAGDLEMTFGDFVEVYKKERFPRLKKDTRAMKENIIDQKITPYFKKKKLNEITATDVIEWQNTLLQEINPRTGERYSKSYLKTIHNQLSAIFNYAVRYYRLSRNPAAIAGNIGDESEIKLHYWTLEQYLRFSEEMMLEPVAYYAFQVLYWLGLREGEMMALTPADFDFEKKTVRVNKTYVVVKGEHMVTSPKTQKSNRIVQMPDRLCEELQEYMAKIPDLKKTDRIFSTVTKSFLYRHIKEGARKAGLPEIRVHDLRHSHVSLLIQMGFSAVAIAERMGHESISVTYHYAHIFPSVQTDMAEHLSAVMEVKKDV